MNKEELDRLLDSLGKKQNIHFERIINGTGNNRKVLFEKTIKLSDIEIKYPLLKFIIERRMNIAFPA